MTKKSPTLAEMTHALSDDELAHYGIKGMKWGVRRTDAELGKVRNSAGKAVGKIGDQSRSALRRLKKMRTGDVAVVDDGDGPVVVVKMRDGSLKETRMSVDAESFLRTMGKTSSEMSTREMNDAVKRAQAIEAYNKVFNPLGDPNAQLRQRAEAMQLQLQYKEAYAKANPPKPSTLARVTKLIVDVEPAFSSFSKMDKVTGGALSRSLKAGIKGLQTDLNSTSSPKKKKSGSKKSSGSNFNPFPTSSRTSRNRDKVYNITDLGKSDPMNPYIPELGGR